MKLFWTPQTAAWPALPTNVQLLPRESNAARRAL